MAIWQTKEWGNMLVESGQAQQVFTIGNIQIEKRSLGMGQYGLFIIAYTGNFEDIRLYEKEFISLAKQQRALFIQIEDLDYEFLGYKIGESSFKKGYYKKFIYPYTALIDLTQTEESILAGMKQKGRYNIKRAKKNNLRAECAEKSDHNIAEFHTLMKETTARDSFSGNTLKYYQDFLSIVPGSELIIVYKDDVAIAGGIFIFGEEEAIYYYGASSSDPRYRNLMAPYLLQWEAIQVAKQRGSQLYDFLGVAPPGTANHSLAGVTQFKTRLTGDMRKVSESYICITRPYMHGALQFLKKLKSVIKK